MTLPIPIERIVQRGLARHAVNRAYRRLVRNASGNTISSLIKKERSTLESNDVKTPLGVKVSSFIIAQGKNAHELFDFSILHESDKNALEQYAKGHYMRTHGQPSFLDAVAKNNYRLSFPAHPGYFDRNVKTVIAKPGWTSEEDMRANVNINLRKRGAKLESLRNEIEKLTQEERERLLVITNLPPALVNGKITTKKAARISRALTRLSKSAKDHEVGHIATLKVRREPVTFEDYLLSEGPSLAVEITAKSPKTLQFRTNKWANNYANYFTGIKNKDEIIARFEEFTTRIGNLTRRTSGEKRTKLACILADPDIKTLEDANAILEHVRTNRRLLNRPASRFYSDKFNLLKEEVRRERE